MLERLRRPFIVVKLEITSQSFNSLFSSLVLVQIDIFIFHTPPELFNQYVVQSPALTVLADRHLVFFQDTRKGLAGELYSLITVEDLRLCLDPRSFQGADAEIALQAVGDLPTDHEAGKPVNDCHEIDESATKPDISNVCAPDLVETYNCNISAQIRVDFVAPLLALTALVLGKSPLTSSVTSARALAWD